MTFNSKLAAAAAALTIAGASVANADYFYQQGVVDDDSRITIEGVTTSMDGVIALYDLVGDEYELISTADVVAGANSDVMLDAPENTNGDLMAVLYHGEVTVPADAVTTIMIDVDDM